ncbi:F-box/kelch-repeat protein [Populus alba x Populus x berolinensis]|nr:F-box/kelch-repeat protein [Populus alba x Populus x berolinensis]
MSRLPQEIIVDILTYLPAKSLIRFKCVCRSWRSLISDPQFAKLHLKRAYEDENMNRQRLLVATDPLYSVDFEAASDGDDGNTLVKIPYPNAESHNDSFAVGLFLGSCDGIVCILDEVDNVVLWNPSTRESKKLPGPSSFLNKDFSTGLGYDSSTDDYKMVIASSATATGSDQIMVEVFTLKTNTWRTVQGSLSGITLGGRYEGVFWNGALLWLGKQEGGAAHDLDVIVPFDIEEEKFMEAVPLPNHFYTAFLSISGNCLCVLGQLKPSGSCFEAWLASEYGVETSWKRLFAVPVDKLYLDCYSTEMWLTKKGEVLVDNRGCPGKLTLYHPVEDARKLLKVENDGDPFYDSAIYTESLVSLC